jgi:hypothetical protein
VIPTVRLGVLADLHLARPGTPPVRFNNLVRLDRSRALLAEALAWLRPRVDAVVLLGDLHRAVAATAAVLAGIGMPAPSRAEFRHRQVIATLRETGLPVLYVGDTEYDIGEGRAAAVLTVGTSYGYRPAEALIAAGAHEVIASLADLRPLLPQDGDPREGEPHALEPLPPPPSPLRLRSPR